MGFIKGTFREGRENIKVGEIWKVWENRECKKKKKN